MNCFTISALGFKKDRSDTCLICANTKTTYLKSICDSCHNLLLKKKSLLKIILRKNFLYNCLTVNQKQQCFNENNEIKSLEDINIKTHNKSCIKCKIIYLHLLGLFEIDIPSNIHIYLVFSERHQKTEPATQLERNQKYCYNLIMNLDFNYIYNYIIFDIENGTFVLKYRALFLFIIFLTGVRSVSLLKLKTQNCKFLNNIFYIEFICKHKTLIKKSMQIKNLSMQELIIQILSFDKVYFFEIDKEPEIYLFANYPTLIYPVSPRLNFRHLRKHFACRELTFLYFSLINLNKEDSIVTLIQEGFKKNSFIAFYILFSPVRQLLNHIYLSFTDNYKTKHFILENHYSDPRILLKILKLYLNEKRSMEILITFLKNFFKNESSEPMTKIVRNFKKTHEEYSDEEYSDEEYSDEEYNDEEEVSNLIQNELETEWFNEEINYRKHFEEFLDNSYIFNSNLPIKMINEFKNWLNQV